MRYLNIGIKCKLLLLLLVICGACTDIWDSHYDVNAKQHIADKTLWQEIESRPELADFARYIKQCGYEELLDGQQMFTVFAPKGMVGFSELNEKKIKKEFVENHIARYSHSANSALPERGIVMQNKKVVSFEVDGDNFFFGSSRLVEKNIITKNGVLHIIDNYEPFFPNVWEFLDSDDNYSILNNYLHSFDTAVIDVEASVPGLIVDGKQEYVDSVIENMNEILYRIGQLDDEDSLYTMIVPTNKAWDKAYATVEKYYTYHKRQPLADSLKSKYTKMAIVNDLVFSHTVQGSVEDSLVSTMENVFYNPFENLLDGFSGMDDGIVCSNGVVFVVDTLRHHPWESWHQELIVEGENEMTLDEIGSNSSSNYRTLQLNDTLYPKVSKHSYIEVFPMNSRFQSEATFFVRNVLSAPYKVKVVLLPQTMATNQDDGVRPNKLKLTLTYKNDKGADQSLKMDYIATNPYAVDTMEFVFVDSRDLDGDGDTKDTLDYMPFPVCNYGEDEVSTTLTIESSVSSSKKVTLPDGTEKKELEVYSKTLLIDCIILEPVKE